MESTQLYRRPVDRAAATFFGSPNFLRGRVTACVESRDGAAITFESPLGSGRCASLGVIRPGEAFDIVVRPEDLWVCNPAAPVEDALVFDGSVVDSVFRGPRSTVYFDNDVGRWGMDLPSTQAPRAGDRIRVAVSWSSLWGLRATDAAIGDCVAPR